ncbi:MAG: hypothetical protein JW751_03340 [Polyangiaceae bacterium]|nr:hypothetical protein [Polyangiaceae bacterium]
MPYPLSGEPVDVVAIQRGDEGAREPRFDLVEELVSAVLDLHPGRKSSITARS